MGGLNEAVRDYRLQRMQELMRTLGYDALAFTSPDWFEWCSNYALGSVAFERPYLLVVTYSGRSFAILCELDRYGMAAQQRRGKLWIDSATYYAEATEADKHKWIATQLVEIIVDALDAAGLRKARIGADVVSDSLARVSGLLPGLAVSPVGAALQSLRWVKHSEELATMRVCAALSDWALDQYRSELRPARLLEEADFTISARLCTEAARRLPGENFRVVRLLTLSGAASASPSGDGVLTGKILENDSIAITTITTRLNGLALELARPWIVGSPPEKTYRLFDCAQAAQAAAIEAAVAGRPVSGIHAAAQRVLDHAGYGSHLCIRAGHGIGVVQHDFPTDLPYDMRPLLERETYAIEPGLYVADLGAFRFADTVAVAADAPECLTTASKERTALSIG